MVANNIKSEQKICVLCGFCCDGTLFLHASLNDGERGTLPEKIEEKCINEDGKDYFLQPCGYFEGKCAIYNEKKAAVCSSYRCNLLRDFSDGKITMDDALETVRISAEMRASLIKEYNDLTGNRSPVAFREIQKNLYHERKTRTGGLNPASDMLQAKCNIFEALLIRHIRAEKDFEKMIITHEADITNNNQDK